MAKTGVITGNSEVIQGFQGKDEEQWGIGNQYGTRRAGRRFQCRTVHLARMMDVEPGWGILRLVVLLKNLHHSVIIVHFR